MKTLKTLFLYITFFGASAQLTNAAMPTSDDIILRHQIGQMLMVGMQETEISATSPIVQQLQELNLGGIVLFTKNITGPTQLQRLTNQLQQHAPTPLFIAVDAEGGRVNRLKPEFGFSVIPGAEEMGKGNEQETESIASILAEQLARMGCNVNLAPVVDVNINPACPVIGKLGRSFSSDPQQVVGHATAFIKAHHVHNIITAIKHFPGHGSSTADSHKGLTDVTDSYQAIELIPYKKLIAAGLIDMVMTAHIINQNVDPENPATLSPHFITEILRNSLHFDGVIISDCLCMRAIQDHYSFEDALIQAINAGCDLLIISGNTGSITSEREAWLHTTHQAVELVLNAIKQGKIKKDRIEQSYKRIKTLKEKYEIIH